MRRVWVDLGANDLGSWLRPIDAHSCWQDHGAGLLLTLAKQHGYAFDVLPLPALHSWAEYRHIVKDYDLVCMNVRSWRYSRAQRAAEVAKLANADIQVWAGGMHATVAAEEMAAVEAFDVIVQGEAEGTWLDLLAGGHAGERIIRGEVGAYTSMDDLPWIDREVWPRTPVLPYKGQYVDPWPLEAFCGWGPGPRVATTISSRKCPWSCHFCYPAEQNHFRQLRRRSVTNVLEELQEIDRRWGPINSVVFHDSEWFMQRAWLEEFVTRYPRETPGWPYWGSARADMIAKWPDLFEAMLEAGWQTVSVGFESGADRMLSYLNKGTTRAQNDAAIDHINAVSARREARGLPGVKVFANLMLAIPGEQPEEAFETLRMARRIRHGIPSLALFAAYPGNVLGDQLRAEGRALGGADNYTRSVDRPKVEGVDYAFYQDLLNGRYDREVGFSVPQFLAAQGTEGT